MTALRGSSEPAHADRKHAGAVYRVPATSAAMTPGALSFLTSLYFGLFAAASRSLGLCEDGAPLHPFASAQA